jgi:hypothetical protein
MAPIIHPGQFVFIDAGSTNRLRRRIAFLPSLVNLRHADTPTRFLPFDFPQIRVYIRLQTFMRILIYHGLSQPAP